MKLFDYLDKNLYNEMIDKGYIYHNTSAKFPGISIINYTKEANFNKIWNEVTEKCRGLIVDDATLDILAIPFTKFYNLEEIELENSYVPNKNIPFNEPYQILEKLDGSLGILFWYNDIPYISTRGSLTSDQALHASKILQSKYKNIIDKLDKNITYIFEIIYPEDLHVVTYKDIDDIFLIGAINKETLEDYDIHTSQFSMFNKAKNYTKDNNGNLLSDWRNIRNIYNQDNKEGFVVKFKSGFRLKLKFEKYWELHFLKSGFTQNKIFELLKDGSKDTLSNVIDKFDEEHQIVYNRIVNKIENKYNNILDYAVMEYRDDFENKKDAALYYNTCKYPSIMFALYTNNINRLKNIIWKEVNLVLK